MSSIYSRRQKNFTWILLGVMSEGVWGRPESPHSQPMIDQSIKNNVVYYNSIIIMEIKSASD